jgi:hypothetical protein
MERMGGVERMREIRIRECGSRGEFLKKWEWRGVM